MPNPAWDPICFDEVECVRETHKAILVKSNNGDWEGEIWLPKSVLHKDNEVTCLGDICTLVLPRWLAEERLLDDVGYEP